MRRLLLGYDLGTSSSKAVVVAEDGRTLGSASAAYPTEMPRAGWAEQDPERWWEALGTSTRAALAAAGAEAREVAAVGLSGQMQGTLALDEAGRPLSPCLTWMDTRAAAEAHELTGGRVRVFGYGPLRLARWLWITGGAPSLTGCDAVSKIAWLRRHQPDVWQRTRHLLDCKDYLLWRATGRLATTADLANLTWLMDTRPGRRAWSPALLGLLGLDEGYLPEIVPATFSAPLTAEAAASLGLAPGTPMVAGASDVCAMPIGAGAVREGVFHLALGTSSWIAVHTPKRLVDPDSYVASMCSAHPTRYAVVASQQAAGAALDWVRQQLSPASAPLDFEGMETLARGARPGAGGLLFLPWLSGERVPVDDARARGGFVNVGLGHGRPELARAAYEGVALNTRWALSRLERLVGRPAHEGLRFAGGGARSAFWCQVLADVLDRPVLPVAAPELGSARGAALLAAHALGVFPDFDALDALTPAAARYEPQKGLRARYDDDFEAFCTYYARNRSWFARRNAPEARGA